MRVRVLSIVVLVTSLGGCGHATAARHPVSPHVGRHGVEAAAHALARPPAARAALRPRIPAGRLLRAGRPIYCGGTHKPYAALTFDDGPGPYTPLALRILRHAHVPATFFLVGRNVGPYRASARREVRGRYALGNHSFTHPLLSALAPGAVLSELLRTSAAISRATGVHVRLFRPPFEARNAVVDRTARRLGLIQILWSVDSADSEGANYSRIARRVTHGLGNGAIVLMHENRGQTIRALKFEILPALRRRHIHLVTVPELLALDPPSATQLRRGRDGCGSRAHSRVPAAS